MSKLDKLTYEVARVLPAVYSESMSYYETLKAVIDKLNETIDEFNVYFGDDVESHVTTILEGWNNDGTLEAIINGGVFTDITNRLDLVEGDVSTIKDTTLVTMQGEIDLNTTDIETLKTDVDALSNAPEAGAGSHTINVRDYQTIQEALNVEGAKTVVFPVGAYAITQPLKVPSNTRLVGYGAIIKRSADINAMILNDSDGLTGLYGASENISIEGLTIDVNKDGYPTDCTAIGVGHCENVTIKNVHFKNIYDWHYIEYNAVKNGVVEGCTFTGYGDVSGTEMLQLDLALNTGTFPWFGPYDFTPCKDIYIKNNSFIDGVDGIGSHSAKEDYHHENVVIEDNSFEGFSGTAVKLLNYKHATIRGNRFEDCLYGVVVNQFNNASRSEAINTVENYFTNIKTNDGNARAIKYGGSSSAFGVLNGLIRGNHIEGVGKHGLGIDYCEGIKVTENFITGCGQVGLWVYGGSKNVISNNRSLNNGSIYYDISVGATGVANGTTEIIVTGNNGGKLNVSLSLGCFVEGNIVDELNDQTNTEIKKLNNRVNGVWI